MFCGQAFTADARDVALGWAGVDLLKKRYGKSWVTTLRRFVEHGPDRAIAMMMSTPWWLEPPDHQPSRCRHFVGSRRFVEQFLGVTAADLLPDIDGNTTKRRGGPVGDFCVVLPDANGDVHEFAAESFFNGYHILTLMVHQEMLTSRRTVMAG
ncbi:MAG: hypothetical protein ACREA0_08155 [bacterium]